MPQKNVVASPNKLKKVLGVAFGIAIVIGSTIGVGILRTPGTIAAYLPSAQLILLCWLIMGGYILLAATSYAELTTMLPKAGGAYNYIKRAFGDYAGFLNGWLDFIANAMTPAFFCIVIGEYCGLLFPQCKPYATLIAVLFLTLFTLINLPGVRSGSIVQQLSSAIKILLFVVLIAGCFLSKHTGSLQAVSHPVLQGGIIVGIFRSLQLIIGSYDGWMSVSFFAEEDEDPGKNIPRSYLMGALSVTILYLLINAAILYVLPVSAIASSPLAASDAASRAFGKWSTDFIIIIAVFSLMSILNAYMMIPARILFGLSRDGFFIRAGAAVNKGGTPVFSLLLCYVISLVLILISSFDQLFALGAFLMNVVMAFAFASLLRLRTKEPLQERPYKAWGYPFTTWLSLAVTSALLIGFALSDHLSLLIVALMIIASYPLYKFFVEKRRSKIPV